MGNPPAYTRLKSFGLHEGPLRNAVHLLKYKRQRRLARPLGRLFLDLDIPSADLVVPVPLHPVRLYYREFNQAALLASEVAKKAGVSLDVHGLVKIKNTPPQVGLRRRERIQNERNAFAVSEKHRFANATVLLVDDVCTTGATIRACSRVLMNAGAKSVHAITLTRSTPDVWKNL